MKPTRTRTSPGANRCRLCNQLLGRKRQQVFTQDLRIVWVCPQGEGCEGRYQSERIDKRGE
jgi:hypothetical protein